MHHLRFAACAFLAFFSAAAPAVPAQSAAFKPAPVEAKGDALLARVAVVGASISGGYGLGKDARGARIDLARVVDASLLGKHEPVLAVSSLMTFADPVGVTQQAVRKLEEFQPTVIVALDYLFWFGYGTSWQTEAERLGALEKGLAPLEAFHCPILLGDFADMHTALDAKVQMLPAQAVPSVEVLAKLNARVLAWSKEHKNVIVVPMSKTMDALLARHELRAGANRWATDAVPLLLQDDGLHTTLEGTAGLWLIALEELLAARKDLPRASVETRVAAIVQKIDPAVQVRATTEPAAPKVEAPAAGKKTR